MNFFLEIIAEFFLTILGVQTGEIYKDMEVPEFVKVLFLLFAVGLISGVLFFCWKILQ